MKINRSKTLKILYWIIVPILASLSYFFVTEAWNNYSFGKTNMSFEEVAIKELPAVTMCIGKPTSTPDDRLFFSMFFVEIHYYKDERYHAQPLSIKLEEGENHVGDEIVTLRKMIWCYTITTTSLSGDLDIYAKRFIRLMFPPLPQGAMNPLEYVTLHVYFTSEQNSYAIDNGNYLTEGKGHVLQIRRQYGRDYYGLAELKVEMTKVIKEKSGCRDESFWNIIDPNFTNLALENCASLACAPNGLPNATLSLCDNYEGFVCSLAEFKKAVQTDKNMNTAPCIKIDYSGANRIYLMDDVQNYWVTTYINLTSYRKK